MRRTREIKLGDLVHAMLREEGLETPLNEFRAEQAWGQLMPPTITNYTTEVQVRGGVMYLKIINAALRQELMMQRSALAARINQHVGAQVIQQIVIR
ncbi:MAG: DUF721 domain-containing protein [Bacteroidales bacterium]|nr:DUF721 domain-containing protein [Bacteroidales bacterium]